MSSYACEQAAVEDISAGTSQKLKPRLSLVDVCAAFAVAVLSACDDSGRVVDHSFGFDAISDSPGITILDYRYGTSNAPGASNTEERRQEGRSVQGTGTTGPMKVGGEMYVKWRINATGEVFEQTADLRNRLPRNMDGVTVYFMVEGRQLNVYAISKKPRDPGTPPVGPRIYDDRKVTRVFPAG